jgi:hypothetical protein
VTATGTFPGTAKLAEFDRASTNGGTSWVNKNWVSAAYSVPIPGQCYDGDYQGISADPAHNRFFFSWGQSPSAGAAWAIEGNTDDP